MLKTASFMKEMTLHAFDGQIGHVADFFFDDETWTIRYVIVNTGSWLSGRSVLISPAFVREVNWSTKQISLNLTKTQVKKSPDIDTHRPVSRQHESTYMDYYGSSYYWGGSSLWGMGPYPGELPMAGIPVKARAAANKRDLADSHLRSTKAVSGYHIDTNDGEIGHVQDYLIDQETWSIRYLEVSTHNWLPGKQVLISPERIVSVDWLESRVVVDLSRETIKSAPEYIESRTMTRAYESRLLDHYGRVPYWNRETHHAHV